MKRGGHVAGRRCSRCLCDSVQIHPTLKRRMCTKRKRDESLGCTKLSSTAKNPPAAGQTPRHERMNHRERISTRVLFFHDNNNKKRLWGKKKKISRLLFPPLQQWQPSALSVSPRQGKASARCDWEEASGSPTHTRVPPIRCVYPPQNERVPPTEPARC